ncbi:alpha/beta fold hydrolase, partial [Rhizobiaceae sp. 2RAB30]
MDQLFARETGTGAETVVLLHGFTGSHQVWAEVQDRLAARARVIAYDLPGHAASLEWPAAGAAKVAVRAVLEDLSRRGIERVHLAGHSMGGAISTLIALAEPGRIASLSLFAPGGFGPEINRRLLVNLAAARSESVLRAAIEAMCGFVTGVSDASVRAAAAMRSIP